MDSNLIRFKDANDSISHSKERAGSLRYDVAIEIHKISTLGPPNQTHVRSMYVFDHFSQTNKYHESG